MLTVSRYCLSALFFILMAAGCRAEDVRADENVTARYLAPVIAIEYPPFTTQDLEGDGVSLDVLRGLLADKGWAFEVDFLPPVRAALDVAAPGNWLLSFFPPREGYPHIQKVILKDADILFGIFRHRKPEPFSWQSLDELRGHTLVTTRTLSNSPVLQPFVNAGLKLVLVNTLDQGVQMMVADRADYVLTTRETGYYYAHKLGVEESELQFGETIIEHFPHVVYVNVTHPLAQQVLHDLQ
ncbi:hypothetical protein ACQUQU_01260 [Thalassolituus sp. LLYu03]|uniref:hypothetical protein n=1 Tax=Thalassolituus sp. LLYu03 TaxID=3421656 RepID=UPI003D27650D